MEERICDDCGETFTVHCHYVLFPIQRTESFRGYCEVKCGSDSIKTHIKLKKILASCTHTNASALEDQFLKKLTTWDLGNFCDFELDRLTEACRLQGIKIWFIKANETTAISGA